MIGTVHVVDDDSSVRDSIRYLMESVGLHVVTHSSSENFLDTYCDTTPSCLILDLRMPSMSGLETQQKIKRKGINIPIIVVTGHGDVPAAVKAMKLGAVDFLEKPCSDQILLDRVHQSLNDDAHRRATQSIQALIISAIESLSPREREVMNLIVSGKSNKESARLLNLSPKTIETHRANVMRKLRVESLVELVKAVVSVSASEES